MSRFMLRGLMSLKYEDFPKLFDKSMCDGCRSSVVLPQLPPDAPAIVPAFDFFPAPFPAPEELLLPTSVSDTYEDPARQLSCRWTTHEHDDDDDECEFV